MFCGNCGAKLEVGEKFCGSCGAPVENASAVFSNNNSTGDNYTLIDDVSKKSPAVISIVGFSFSIDLLIKIACPILLIFIFMPWINIDAITMYGIQVSRAESVNGWVIAFGSDDFDGVSGMFLLFFIPFILFICVLLKNTLSSLQKFISFIPIALIALGIILLAILAIQVNDEYAESLHLAVGFFLTIVTYIIIAVLSVLGILKSRKKK
jgi:hypothetical protein